jgi:hypothetical protein
MLRAENRVALAALVERLQQMQQASIRRSDHSRAAVFPS